jgi:hypothetical protein
MYVTEIGRDDPAYTAHQVGRRKLGRLRILIPG